MTDKIKEIRAAFRASARQAFEDDVSLLDAQLLTHDGDWIAIDAIDDIEHCVAISGRGAAAAVEALAYHLGWCSIDGVPTPSDDALCAWDFARAFPLLTALPYRDILRAFDRGVEARLDADREARGWERHQRLESPTYGGMY